MFNICVFLSFLGMTQGYKDDQGGFIPGSATVDDQGVYDSSKGLVGGYVDQNGNYVPNSDLAKKPAGSI